MSCAAEREWNRAQMAMLLTQYIHEHGSISIDEAMQITGGSRWQVYRLLRAMDGVLAVYVDGRRRVLLKGEQKDAPPD